MSAARIRIILWVAVGCALVGLTLLSLYQQQARDAQGLFSSDESAFYPQFSLLDDKGETITDQTWRGHPVVVFFGFTHCPDICPITLVDLESWLEELGDRGASLKAYFVTLDPERDGVQDMARFLGNFSGRITGITGDPEAIQSMSRSMGIYSKKIGEDDDYTVDHTASIFLIRPDGSLMGTIALGENPDMALDKLKRLASLVR